MSASGLGGRRFGLCRRGHMFWLWLYVRMPCRFGAVFLCGMVCVVLAKIWWRKRGWHVNRQRFCEAVKVKSHDNLFSRNRILNVTVG